MRKYWVVFQQSFQNEFVYRLNFILWRFRNVLRILMTYFLWHSVFSSNTHAFGYSKEQMMAYVFLVLLITSFVMSAPSNDNVGGEISDGTLNNFLIKPIGYLRYWLTRDWASKLLNMLFAVFEFTLLYFLFRPQIYFSESPLQIFLGLGLAVISALFYFVITKAAISVAFWTPENTWGLMFIILVFMEVLAGSIFPLDLLPKSVMTFLQFTPFPYMIYYPIAILVGKVDIFMATRIIFQSLALLFIYYWFTIKIWRKGLKIYAAVGI